MSVKVSPKYQVVIPEAVRTAIGISAGSRIEVIAKGKVAYLVPVTDGPELQAALAS
jgi:AbrB family looped-hinge helix DNA binding protein